MKKIFFIILFMHFGTSENAWSWGSLTHKAIAEIAQQDLTSNTEAIVRQILLSEPSNSQNAEPVERLAQVANWADAARGSSEYKHTSDYHFEKIDDGSNFLESLQGQTESEQRKGSVIEALLVAEKILRDSSLSYRKKAPALKFIIHFVGDLHQPLHSGRNEDMGGNKLDVNWFNDRTNLHSVWDTGIIYTGRGDILQLDDPKANSPYLYAQFLVKKYEKLKPQAQQQKNLQVWLQESLSLRPLAYNEDYLYNQNRYLNDNLSRVDQRAYFAGVRLSQLLNDIFANQIVSDRELLYQKVENIVGNLRKIIDFNPRYTE